MDYLLGLGAGAVLFGSISWLIVAMTAVFFLLFYSERTENGFVAFFAVAVFVVVSFFWGNYDILAIFTVWSVSSYLVTGFVFSVIRTYFYGRKKLDYDNEAYLEREIRSRKNELKEHVFRWWFLWPVSMVNWFFSDLLKDVWDWIYAKSYKLFNYILDMGLNSQK